MNDQLAWRVGPDWIKAYLTEIEANRDLLGGRGQPDRLGPKYRTSHNRWLYAAVRREPEEAWVVIQQLVEATDDRWALIMIAAGPLEDLLVEHGAQFIDRVGDLANRSDRFALTCTGVWGWSRMSPKLLSSLQAIRDRLADGL